MWTIYFLPHTNLSYTSSFNYLKYMLTVWIKVYVKHHSNIFEYVVHCLIRTLYYLTNVGPLAGLGHSMCSQFKYPTQSKKSVARSRTTLHYVYTLQCTLSYRTQTVRAAWASMGRLIGLVSAPLPSTTSSRVG